MNEFWLLVFALITQETLLSHVAIFGARDSGLPWMLIHLMWLFITVLHIVLPYMLAVTLSKRVTNQTFWRFIKKLETHFSVDNKASSFLFFVLGIFNFVYINSFLLGFLKVKPFKPTIYIFLGDLVWYALVASSTLFGVNILSSIQTLFFAFLLCLVFGYFGGEVIKMIKKR